MQANEITIHNVNEVTFNEARNKYEVQCVCGWVFRHAYEGNVAYYANEHVALQKKLVGKTERELWLDRIAASNGAMRLLGQGASRDVYKLDATRVIKIERHVDANAWHGINQCNRERAYWDNANEEQRKYLATILESGDGWVIMERAKNTLSGICNDKELSRTICTDFSRTIGMNDLHAHNIGYFGNGIFKIIDYAL